MQFLFFVKTVFCYSIDFILFLFYVVKCVLRVLKESSSKLEFTDLPEMHFHGRQEVA